MEKTKKALVIGVRYGMTSSLPTESVGGGDYLVGALVFSMFCRYGPQGEMLPDLAERWDVDAARGEIVYHLRHNAVFHDGTPVTAADAVHSYQLYRNATLAGIRQSVEKISSLDAIDDYTVKMAVVHPQSVSPMDAQFAVMPKHAVLGENGVSQKNMIGSGPYRYAGKREDGAVELKAFDGYFGGRPRLREIVIKSYKDEDALWCAFMRGETDLQMFMPRVQYQRILNNRGFQAYALDAESAYALVPSQNGAMSDSRMRRAMSLALDRQKVIDVVEDGLAQERRTLFADEKKSAARERDPIAASRLLDEAGYIDSNGDGIREKDGKPLVVRVGYDVQSKDALTILKVIRQQWADLGVGMQAVLLPLAVLGDSVWRGGHLDAELIGTGFFQSIAEAVNFSPDLFGISAGNASCFEPCRLLSDSAAQNECAVHVWVAEEPAIVLYRAMFFHGISSRVKHNDRFFSLYTPSLELKDWDIAE